MGRRHIPPRYQQTAKQRAAHEIVMHRIAKASTNPVPDEQYGHFMIPVYLAVENVKAGRCDHGVFWSLFEGVTFAHRMGARLFEFCVNDDSRAELLRCEPILTDAAAVMQTVAERYVEEKAWRFGAAELDKVLDAVALCDEFKGIATEGHLLHALYDTAAILRQTREDL